MFHLGIVQSEMLGISCAANKRKFLDLDAPLHMHVTEKDSESLFASNLIENCDIFVKANDGALQKTVSVCQVPHMLS